MRRRNLSLLSLSILALIATACTDQVPSDLGNGRPGSLSIAPRFSVFAGQQIGPISRIRLTARVVPGNNVVADTVITVSPDSAEWHLNFNVPPNAGSVIVEITALSVVNGVETVEFSGVTPPIAVTPGQNSSPTTPVTLTPGPLDNLTVTSVSISPRTPTVIEGGTVQLAATVTGGGPNVHILWGSLDPAVATVDVNGFVTTLRNGSARILANAGPRADTITINASQRVASVTVTPDTQRLSTFGSEAQFTARVLDPRGAEILGAGATFTITNNAIADQTTPGRFRAKANGTTSIIVAAASAPTILRTATLIVAQRAGRVSITPPSATANAIGGTQQFNALVSDANGNGMDAPVVWRSNNPTIATISNTGLATARGNGTADIVAVANAGSPDSIVAHAQYQVLQSIGSLTVTPDGGQLNSIGDTIRFTVQARDANGNVMPTPAVTWQVANASVGSIDANGTFRAESNGATVVTAIVGTIRSSVSVQVQQIPTSVTVTRAVDTMVVNTGKLFNATVRDARGNPITGLVVTWASSDTTKAVVNNAGFVNARAAGTVTISATHNGIRGNATLVVQNDPRPNLRPTLVFSPGLTVVEHDTVKVSVRVKNIGGGPSGATTTQFQILNAAGNVVVFDTTLTVRILAANDSVIFSVNRVAEGAFPDSVKLRVIVDPANIVTESLETDNSITSNTVFYQLQTVASVHVSPANVSPNSLGDTVRFTAIARDSRGNIMPGVVFNWTSQTPALGSVDATGLFTALGNGNAIVRATVGAVFGEGVAHVLQVAASFAVAPHADTVLVNNTRTLTAVVKDARGNPIASAVPTWSSSDSTKATVAPNGVVTGKAVGNAFIRAVYNSMRDSALVVVKTLGTPNLVVASLTSVPATEIVENDSVHITFKVRNVGTDSARATSRAMFTLISAADNTIIDTSSVVVPKLAAGDSAVFTKVFGTFGIGDFPDHVKLRVIADFDNTVAESNEADNVFTSASLPVRFVARTWAPGGTGSTNWLDPNNWSPRGVPRPSVDITIPAGLASYPVLTSHVQGRNLTMLNDATINLGAFNLQLTGTQAFSTQITGTGAVILIGSNVDIAGTFPNMFVTQGARVVGLVEVSRDLRVSGGDLDVNTQEVIVLGNFYTEGAGALKMFEELAGSTVGTIGSRPTSANRSASSAQMVVAQLNVTGNLTFTGASTAGKLNAGYIYTHGNFFALPGAFSADAGNKLYMYGSAPTALELQAPAQGSSNHFGTLYIANGFGVTVTGDIVVLEELGFGTAGPTLNGTGTATLYGDFEDVVANGLSFQMANLVLAGIGDAEIPHVLNANTTLKRAQHLASETGMQVGGNLTIDGGALFFDFSSVNVGGDLTTVNGGIIDMHSEYDALHIQGNATFAGGNSVLTNGQIFVGKNFTGSGAADAFTADDNLTVHIYNGNERSVPGTISLAAGQEFGDLVIDTDTDLLTDITVTGNLTIGDGVKLVGDGKTLTSTGNIVINFDCSECANRIDQPAVAARQRNMAMPDPGYYADEEYRVTNTVLAGSGQLIPSYITTNMTIVSDQILNFDGESCTAVEVHGNVIVSGANLSLKCGLTVDDDFTTTNGGTLDIPELFCECSGPSLDVYGNVTFDGGSEVGKLQRGEIRMFGTTQTFSVGSNPTAFVSEGLTVVLGEGDKTFTLAHPGTQTFQRVQVNGGVSNITLTNGMVAEQIDVGYCDCAFIQTIGGAGSLVLHGSIYMNGVTFNGVTLVLDVADRGSINSFNGNTFGAGYTAVQDQLVIKADTNAINLHNLTFTVTPSSGFYHVRADGNLLDVYMFNPTPFDTLAGARFIGVNGATVHWPFISENVPTPPARVIPIKH